MQYDINLLLNEMQNHTTQRKGIIVDESNGTHNGLSGSFIYLIKKSINPYEGVSVCVRSTLIINNL